MKVLTAVAGVTILSGVANAMPLWSWDTIQTYVHCANFSGVAVPVANPKSNGRIAQKLNTEPISPQPGEWNDDALRVLSQQPFVVFEKYHKVFVDPPFDEAEAKIAESCAKVKALNASVQCLMVRDPPPKAFLVPPDRGSGGIDRPIGATDLHPCHRLHAH